MTVPKPTRKKRVPGDMNQAFAKPPSFKWSAPLEYCRQLGKAPHHIKVHSLAKRRSIDFVADVDHAIHQVNNAAELEMTEDDRFKLNVRALEIWHYCALTQIVSSWL